MIGGAAQGTTGRPDAAGQINPSAILVSGLAQSYVGLTAYMRDDALDRLMLDGPRVSGARILIDGQALPALYEAVKTTPASPPSRSRACRVTGSGKPSNRTSPPAPPSYVTLAVIITFGVVYNSARIQLSERARETGESAGLRVHPAGSLQRADDRARHHRGLRPTAGLADRLPACVGRCPGFANDMFRIRWSSSCRPTPWPAWSCWARHWFRR